MEVVLAILGYVGIAVFVAALLTGALMALLGLPGTVLIWLTAVVYSAATGWTLPLWLLGVLLGMSLFAEISDNVISALGVKRFGGSTRGMVWALVGGISGALVVGLALGPVVPVVGPVIAPIAGGLAGGFTGGYLYERRQGLSVQEARRAGVGAMLGRVAGVMLKSVLAAIMVAVVLINAF